MNHRVRRGLAARPRVEPLDERLLLSGLTPAQVAHAYGLDSVDFAGGSVHGDGSGQTIAVIEAYHDPYLVSDLRAFSAAYDLPVPQISVTNLAGSATNDGWASEAALDVEWAHAIAPGAKILLVEAASEAVADMMAAVDVARHAPGVSVVSMSWGFPEFSGQVLYDSLFTTPSGHPGVTFVAASGDSGLWGGAEWPASSPNVISVGATTLRLDDSGAIASESAWPSSGAGLSLYEPEPSYQRGIQASGRRSTPDVAFLGDPQVGVSVCFTTPSTGSERWDAVGGTSLGAPAWSGIFAIADQGLALAGKGPLDGPSQGLPALYGIASASASAPDGANDYRPVRPAASLTFAPPWATGNGTPVGAQAAAMSAPPGGTTGLGTPTAKLLADLAATPLATSPPSSSIAAPTPAVPVPSATAAHSPMKRRKHNAVVRKRPIKFRKIHHRAVRHDVIDAAIAALA